MNRYKLKVSRWLAFMLVAFTVFTATVPLVAYAEEYKTLDNTSQEAGPAADTGDSGSSDTGSDNGGYTSGSGVQIDTGRQQNILNQMSQNSGLNVDMAGGEKSIGGLKKGVSKIISILMSLAIFWIPVTIIADVLVTLIPPLENVPGLKKDGKGIYIGTAKRDSLKGDKPMEYVKGVMFQLIVCFVVLALVLSNTYMTVITLCADVSITFVNWCINFVSDMVHSM